MPFPPLPDELEKATIAAVERSTKVEFELSDTLTKLKTAFGKIDAAAFDFPETVATTGQEIARIEQSVAGQKVKINTFIKSLTDCTKEIFAKFQQLKKEKAKPPAIKHVESMRSVASAFAERMAKLCPEAEQLITKARERLKTPAAAGTAGAKAAPPAAAGTAGTKAAPPAAAGTAGTKAAPGAPQAEKAGAKAAPAAPQAEKPGAKGAPAAPQADEFLPQGLKLVKSQPGLFALAIGGQGAYLVAGPRLAPGALKQAKEVTGGGSFVRGDCEWNQEKSAYVFGLKKKPPSGLAKKIRKAILDQTLNQMKVKVLVRGPGGQEIDADTDADTLGAVELEAVELEEDAPEAPPPPPPPPPRQDSIVFAQRMRALSPVYDKTIKLNPAAQAELDKLSAQATTAAQQNDWKTALAGLDAYEAALKRILAAAASRPAAGGTDSNSQAKPAVRNVIFQQSRLLWDQLRKKILVEVEVAVGKLIAHCKTVNEDPKATIRYNIPDVEAKSKKLHTLLEDLDGQLIDKLDEALNAKTPELRAEKLQEAKGLIDEYERKVNKNAILTAMKASQVARSDIRDMILTVLNTMKSKM